MRSKIVVEKTQSKGIAIGNAYKIKKHILVPDTYTPQSETEEKEKFYHALKESQEELRELAKNSEIFEAYLVLSEDVMLEEGVLRKIEVEKKNIEVALMDTVAEIAAIFEGMDNEYMRERSVDIQDVGNRILSHIKGTKVNIFSGIQEKVILVAEDFTPSDTANMNFDYVLGFITEKGGVTSHVSIIARGLGIPAIVGVSNKIEEIKQNDKIIMDSEHGMILIEPDEKEIADYENKQKAYEDGIKMRKNLNMLTAATIDSRKVKLYANVGSIEDIKSALQYNIDGIGLFRTEFLYMNSDHFPTEEEQFQQYKEAVVLCKKELTIRTLDIGGDKSLPYYEFEKEENPFLGWRAIRISLELKQMFKEQLRAILRASCYGPVRMMYPMIISLDELNDANKVLAECKKELKREGKEFNINMPVGIMIETPAAVIMAETFAAKVDFFSIGTNDLTQYILAVDRGNRKISRLYNSYDPAVLGSIKRIIDAAHKHNITVCMCGEMAGEEKGTELLLGMGLDEFSMTANQIPEVKYIVRNTTYVKAKEKADHILCLESNEEIAKKLN